MKRFLDIDPASASLLHDVPGDWRRPSAKEKFQVLWDDQRKYGQLWPRPSTEDVFSFYQVESYYTHGDFSTGAFRPPTFLQRVLTKLSWWADGGVDPSAEWWTMALGAKPLRILEVGCGDGSNLCLLSDLGHTVVGVEPDTLALKRAQGRGLCVYEGTAEALPKEVLRDRFDAIIFMHVLEHCIDPMRAMSEAAHLLKDSGMVVAEVPNNECIGRVRFGPLWYWLDVPRHLNFFSEQSLSDLLEAVGLKTQSIFFRGYCRQFSPEWQEAQTGIAETFGTPRNLQPRIWVYWLQLLQSAMSSPVRKYDSIRIVGKF